MAILAKVKQAGFVLLPALVWCAGAFWLSFEGMWMSAVAPENNAQAFVTYAQQQMADKLPGAGALVIIEDGEVASQFYQSPAESTGQTQINIDGDTLFPAASMSKFVAALAIHQLVLQTDLELDSSIASVVQTWQLPVSEFDHNEVTVSRLLSHTAGLTDGLGFGDYQESEEIPSLVDTLNHPRSASGDKHIQVGIEPGTQFAYSGGSYLLLELLIEEVTGQSYASWVRQHILTPRGMVRTHFDIISGSSNYSPFFDAAGLQAEVFHYASSAATGMNTSANDLVALLQSLLAQPQMMALLSQPMGHAMGAPIWGQGAMLYAPLDKDQFIIGHDGSNDPAINTSIRINPITGDGYIALVSGHPSLASEIGFEWVLWQSGKPDFIFAQRAIDSALVPMLVGAMGWMFSAVVMLLIRRRWRSQTH